MGIINVTPDSFADGGLRFDPARAVDAGWQMLEDGADMLDVGGESTRPGAEPVDAAEELRRVLPVLEAFAGRPLVSIDTYKAVVAREAIARGAAIVNDVSALQYDQDLAGVVAESGAAVVLMHNRGRSRDMYREAVYDDAPAAIRDELQQSIAAAVGRRRRASTRSSSIPGLASRRRRSTRIRRWRASIASPRWAVPSLPDLRASRFSAPPSATCRRTSGTGRPPRPSPPVR